MQAIAFNFLIAGTDAHAKNYSMLFGRNQARLAPLYDLASYLPYFGPLGKRWQDVRMPMKIGDNYLYDAVYSRHWERLASAAGYPAREALGHVTTLAAALPAAAEEIAAEMRTHGLDHAVLDRLVSGIVSRCQSVARAWEI
jgi:serine/threonine-protein kinase HipA